MKHIFKIIGIFLLATTLVVSCTKKEEANPYYNDGTAPMLSASASTIAPQAPDSSKTVVTFSWTNPMYSTDTSKTMYVLEVDSSGRNFTNSVKTNLTGKRTMSLTAKELNAILVGFGFNFNVAYDLDVRVTSYTGNGNEMKMSNVVKVKASAYKIPPKVELPVDGRLFIVGDASTFGWSNSSTVNVAEEFSKIDETTWAGIFDLSASGSYLILPIKGAWSTKFALEDDNVAGVRDGGDFKYYGNGVSGGSNFKTVATAGKYLVTLNFQTGKFSVVPYTGPQMPTDLFMVGDATPASWNNPATGATVQPLTRMNSAVWEMPSIAITGGKEYLVLPVAGSWSNKYAVANKTLAGLAEGGTFGYNLNDNFPGPAVGGNYKISLNFASAKFKTTKL